ncbi:MAG TPA: SDR family NAD(P)-dependent oxidoreductase, partial [Actinomycetales bacterium]
MAELEGRVAIVAGGGSGIGRACVDLLAARGAQVRFCDVDAAAVTSYDHRLVRGDVVDVTDEQAVAGLVRR